MAGRVSNADEAALARLADRLAQRAKGNFLVLKLFLSRSCLGGRFGRLTWRRQWRT